MSKPANPGADYVAVVRLSNKANDTLAVPGETCDRVPAGSLPWLLQDGYIAPATEKTAKKGKG
jgi:hypothetical protein